MSYATRGDYAPALWGFRRAVHLDPHNSVHWNDLGVTLLRLQRFPSAEAAFQASLRRDGGTQAMVDQMQTRAELYATIGYHEYEALDASIVATIVPQGMPQR